MMKPEFQLSIDHDAPKKDSLEGQPPRIHGRRARSLALDGREPQLVRAPPPRPRPRTPSIVLWMAGGMAQTETFDPKRYTPFEPGVRTEQRAQHVPGDRHRRRPHQVFAGAGAGRARSWIAATLIRTFQAADLGFILHSRHQYHWHTGYIPPQTVAVPHIGAVIAKTLGPRNPTVPAFVAIGQNLEIGAESPRAEGVPHGRLSRVRNTDRS